MKHARRALVGALFGGLVLANAAFGGGPRTVYLTSAGVGLPGDNSQVVILSQQVSAGTWGVTAEFTSLSGPNATAAGVMCAITDGTHTASIAATDAIGSIALAPAYLTEAASATISLTCAANNPVGIALPAAIVGTSSITGNEPFGAQFRMTWLTVERTQWQP